MSKNRRRIIHRPLTDSLVLSCLSPVDEGVTVPSPCAEKEELRTDVAVAVVHAGNRSKHGQFYCEFRARHGQINDKNEIKVTKDRASNTAASWRHLVFQRRECGWRYNYTFNLTSKTYHLTCKEEEHKGHTFKVSPAGNVVELRSMADVTATMMEMMTQWAGFRCNTQAIRQVSTARTALASRFRPKFIPITSISCQPYGYLLSV